MFEINLKLNGVNFKEMAIEFTDVTLAFDDVQIFEAHTFLFQHLSRLVGAAIWRVFTAQGQLVNYFF